MKKFLALLMVLVFALSVSGCGGENKQTSSSSASSAQATEQKQAEPKKEAPQEDPNATVDQKNAVKTAWKYAQNGHSKTQIAENLVKFDKFSEADAEYAISKLTNVDWNKVALIGAESYIKNLGMSKAQTARQLEHGGFTDEEVQYAMDNVKADWNKLAARSAKNYQRNQNLSTERIRGQLKFEGFTDEEIEYAISQLPQ